MRNWHRAEKRHEDSGFGTILGLLIILAAGIAIAMLGMAPTVGMH